MDQRKKQFLAGLGGIAFLCLLVASVYISAQVEHVAVMAILLVSTGLILFDLRCASSMRATSLTKGQTGSELP